MNKDSDLDLEHFLRLIWHSKIVLLGFLILGTILGFLFSKTVNPVYKVEVNAYSPLLDNSHSERILKEINLRKANDKLAVLAEKMQLVVADLESVKEIQPQVSRLEKGYFNFNILLYNTASSEKIIKGIQNYFKANSYNQKIKNSYQEQYDNILNSGNKELRKIEQVQNAMLNKEEGFQYNGNIFEESFNITKGTAEFKVKAELNEIIEILNNPVKPIAPYFPNPLLFAIVGAFLCLTLGLIFVIIRALF